MSKATLLATSSLIPAGAILAMAGRTEDQLREAAEALLAEHKQIIEAADAAGADLTDEQLDRLAAIKAEVEKLGKQIQARSDIALPSRGRQATPEPRAAADPARPAPASVVSPRARDPRCGFASFGEQAIAVRAVTIGRASDEQRNKINAAVTTYGNEGVGADGGFAVIPEFSREIWQKVQAEENLLSRCAPLMVGGNSMTLPKDETTPWQSSGGVQVYWEGEAAAITPSKPAFEQSTVRLVKLSALVPISDENLEDAVGLESYLRAKAPAKMASKINDAIVRGTGVGQPLGILASPSMISVTKETSQAADTIYFANINKMWARMYAPWRRNAIWLINQDVEPQLDAMAFDPAASSKVPVYLPPGGLSATPYASLKGRPVVPIEACSTVGDQGDIILVDLMQYWALQKAAGIRTDTSIHLYFDQSVTTFRFVFRLNGQPAWSSTISPQHGSLTRSWAVALDDRT